jgi:curved DNA-binding protein CbpA
MSADVEMNFYIVLGLPTTADAIRTAFRTLARRYHRDAGAGSSAHRFREVVEAYETLSDPIRRRRYDETLHTVRVHVRHGALGGCTVRDGLEDRPRRIRFPAARALFPHPPEGEEGCTRPA